MHATAVGEQTRKVLEDSLSIIEIDQEIKRIEVQQTEAQNRQQSLQKQLYRQREQIQWQRERAGAVVQSYYMGDRGQLLTVLLSARNIHQVLTLLDYYELIISHDQDVLTAYQQKYSLISTLEQQTANTAVELQQVKDKLLAQRSRVAALKERVNNQLHDSSDAQTLKRLIEEMTSYWENVGLYEVRRYFKAITAALQGLPQFIREQPDAIVSDGKTYTITIQQHKFNEFLQTKDDIFKQSGFIFVQDGVIVQGTTGTLNLWIKGHYTVENTPKNAIVFHVDRLVFNGLELPDTTRHELEKQFDLNFYPQMLLSYIKATGVATEPGQLKVQLELNL